MKFGCICGWIGNREDHLTHNGCNVCPRCLRLATVRYTHPVLPCIRCKSDVCVLVIGSNLYHCNHCGINFDNDPDEGGDYHHRDPSRRLVREEDRAKRKAEVDAEQSEQKRLQDSIGRAMVAKGGRVRGRRTGKRK